MFTDVWGMETTTGTVLVEADRDPESPFSSGFTASMNEPIPASDELKSDIQKGINTPPKMELRKEPSATPADALNVSTGKTAGGVNLENCVAKGVISAVKTAARMFLLEDISLMYQYVFGSSGSMYDFDGRNVSLDEVQSRGALALVLGGYGISSMVSGVTAMSTSFGEAGIIGFRYMSEGELTAIKNTHLLRGGTPGATYFTKDLYKSATKAQSRLSLSAPPELRVEFEILNNPNFEKFGTKVDPFDRQIGGGSEFKTFDPVEVRIINSQPLRKK